MSDNTKASNTQKVVKGISSQTLVTIVLGVVEIVSFSIMSRLLTKEDFGYYAAITAITTIFASFSETGIGSALIQRKELNKRYIDNAFTLSLLFGGFLSLLLFFLSGPLSKAVVDSSMKIPLMIMSVTLLCNCLTSINVSLMKRKLQFLKLGVLSLISFVIPTVIAIVLAINGNGYYAIIIQAVLGSVLLMLLTYFFAKTRYSLALDKTTFKSIFKFSGWLMASSIFRNIAQYIDRLLMPRLISVEALGAYNRPKDFITKISTKLNGIFDTALFPVLSGIQDEKEKLAAAYRRSFYYMNIFAMLLTLTFVFNSELMIRIFFGEEWMSLRGLMIVISFSLLFNIDGRLADCYLRSLAMTKQQFYFRMAETIIASASVIIGFKWGIMGVALTVMITNMIIKLFKVVYVAWQVEITLGSVLSMLFTSWKFALFVLPPTLLMFFVANHTVWGNILLLAVFAIAVVLVFLVFPTCVGEKYKTEVHNTIIGFIKGKLHIK